MSPVEPSGAFAGLWSLYLAAHAGTCEVDASTAASSTDAFADGAAGDSTPEAATESGDGDQWRARDSAVAGRGVDPKMNACAVNGRRRGARGGRTLDRMKTPESIRGSLGAPDFAKLTIENYVRFGTAEKPAAATRPGQAVPLRYSVQYGSRKVEVTAEEYDALVAAGAPPTKVHHPKA